MRQRFGKVAMGIGTAIFLYLASENGSAVRRRFGKVVLGVGMAVFVYLTSEKGRATRRRFAKVAIGIGAAFWLFPGLWAFLGARSFFEKTEPAPTVHFIHNMGVLMVGIAVWAIASLIFSDVLAAALTGLAVVSGLDTYLHFQDLHVGGVHLRDPWILAVVTLVQVAALIFYSRGAASPASSAQVRAAEDDQVPVGQT
jgi:hypothetical protein